MMNLLFYEGNTLISGNVATGKTTLMIYVIESILARRRNFQLMAFGNIDCLNKLSPHIRLNPLNLFCDVVEAAPEKNSFAVERLFTRIKTYPVFSPLLIAIDESYKLFADEAVMRQFAHTILRLREVSGKNVYLVMTAQNPDIFYKVYGEVFFNNLDNHILLQNTRQNSLLEFEVATTQLKNGEAVVVTRHEQMDRLYFKPGDPSSVKEYEGIKQNFLQKFSGWLSG